jgi:hypothetical protein
VRPAIGSAAALLLISCDSHALFGPSEMVSSSEAAALATYFPPSEINGGWRKRTNPERIREMSLDPDG